MPSMTELNITPKSEATTATHQPSLAATPESITDRSSGRSSGRKYGGLSMDQRRAQRREQFLHAGLEVFGTQGFRASTVRGICKEAKLTDRYFYESYGSLEKLLMAVYEDCMLNLIKELLSSMGKTYQVFGAEKAIEVGLTAYFQALEEPRVARICMVELEGISPEVNKLYNNYIQSISNILIGLANAAYPDWELSQAEKEVIGISLVGALRQSTTNWLMTDYATERSIVVAGTLKLFIGIIDVLSLKK